MEIGLVYSHPSLEHYLFTYSVVETSKGLLVMGTLVDKESYETISGSSKEIEISKKDLKNWHEVQISSKKKGK